MGYVLPVSRFQYEDYKRRIIPSKQNLFYINRSYRPILDRNYQDVMSNLKNYRENVGGNQWYISERYSEALEVEITGKGKNINIHV